jgi:hypothetical protein
MNYKQQLRAMGTIGFSGLVALFTVKQGIYKGIFAL